MATTDVCLCGDENGIHDPKTGACKAMKGATPTRLSHLLGGGVAATVCGCLSYDIDRKATWHADKARKKANGGKETRLVKVLRSAPGMMLVKAEGGYIQVPCSGVVKR